MTISIKNRVKQLKKSLENYNNILILPHNTPDPDAMAAAASLKFLIEEITDCECDIAYSGILGRAENKALFNLCTLHFKRLNEVNEKEYDLLFIVDAQPFSANISMPKKKMDIAVIDHHTIKVDRESLVYADLREHYGSTSTIIYQYIRSQKLKLPEKLATTLFYGVKTDIEDTGRDKYISDYKALKELFSQVSLPLLFKIEHPKVNKRYFQQLAQALENATIMKDTLVSNLGIVDNPEIIAQMADSFLNIIDINWTFCIGEVNSKIHFSLRSMTRIPSISSISEILTGKPRFAGGHGKSAGGLVPLRKFPEKSSQEISEMLINNFLKFVHRDKTEATLLAESEEN